MSTIIQALKVHRDELIFPAFTMLLIFLTFHVFELKISSNQILYCASFWVVAIYYAIFQRWKMASLAFFLVGLIILLTG